MAGKPPKGVVRLGRSAQRGSALPEQSRQGPLGLRVWCAWFLAECTLAHTRPFFAADSSSSDDVPSVYESEAGPDENELPEALGRMPFAETQQVGGGWALSLFRWQACRRASSLCVNCLAEARSMCICACSLACPYKVPFPSMHQTVPETPSPDVVTANKPDRLRRAAMAASAAAGRNVDEHSPGKGRVAKVARTSTAAGAMGPPAAFGSAYLGVCQQVGA